MFSSIFVKSSAILQSILENVAQGYAVSRMSKVICDLKLRKIKYFEKAGKKC